MTITATPDIELMNQKLIELEKEVRDLKAEVARLSASNARQASALHLTLTVATVFS